MSNCNTIAIGRPTTNSMPCVSGCSDLGPVDPLYKNQLGPRKNREKVRMQIRDYILNMLGAPVIKLELDEQNIDFCIDQALKIFEDYAPREYYSYYVFQSVPGKSVYEMPPDVGLIRNVYYKEMGQYAFQASDLGGAIPIDYYNGVSELSGFINPQQPVWGDMGNWVLYKQYEQTYSRVSSNLGGWEWVGDYKHIKLYPIPNRGIGVIVHYIQKMKDWMEVTQAMQEGALTYAKEIVGRIRGRIKNPPGPNGGLQLDGDQLIQEAREDREKWKEDLLYKFGEPSYITMD